MQIDTPTIVPAECSTLVEELVRNAVDFGRASVGSECAIALEEYTVLTFQRKFLYEYLEQRVIIEPGEAVARLRFR